MYSDHGDTDPLGLPRDGVFSPLQPPPMPFSGSPFLKAGSQVQAAREQTVNEPMNTNRGLATRFSS